MLRKTAVTRGRFLRQRRHQYSQPCQRADDTHRRTTQLRLYALHRLGRHLGDNAK